MADFDDSNFKSGEFVTGITNWEELSLLLKTGQLRKIQQDDGIPLSYHVGLLGHELAVKEDFRNQWEIEVEQVRSQ
ncbi:hypothetical protein R6Q59_014131 [Mikania micrantha]